MKSELSVFIKALHAERAKLDKMITLAESMREVSEPEIAPVKRKAKGKKAAKANGTGKGSRPGYIASMLPLLADAPISGQSVEAIAAYLKVDNITVNAAITQELKKEGNSRVQRIGRGTYILAPAGITAYESSKVAPAPVETEPEVEETVPFDSSGEEDLA